MREEVRTREETVYIGECPECKKEQISTRICSVDILCTECRSKINKSLSRDDLLDAVITEIGFNSDGTIRTIAVENDSTILWIGSRHFDELLYS